MSAAVPAVLVGRGKAEAVVAGALVQTIVLPPSRATAFVVV